MERLLEVLLREASASLPSKAACGCDECQTARRSNQAEGVCQRRLGRLEDFLASRIRRRNIRGASAHARLVEDARRFGRVETRLGVVDLCAPFAMLERRIETYSSD